MIRCDRRTEDVYINVTPMIDLMIFLIVFFLAATEFAQIEREHDILLPQTRGVGGLSKALENKLVINVKRDGEIIVEGRKCREEDLLAFVATRNKGAGNKLKVKIRADKRTPYGNVAAVLAIVEKAGVSAPFINTQQENLEN